MFQCLMTRCCLLTAACGCLLAAASISERAPALVALGDSGSVGSIRVQQVIEAGIAGSGATTSGARLYHGFAPVLINDPYLLQDDSFAVDGADSLSLTVLENDRDIDGGPLSLTAVGSAQHGSVTVVGDVLYYQPQPGGGFTGSDTLTYTVTDAEGYTAQATVALTLNGWRRIGVLLQRSDTSIGGVAGIDLPAYTPATTEVTISDGVSPASSASETFAPTPAASAATIDFSVTALGPSGVAMLWQHAAARAGRRHP